MTATTALTLVDGVRVIVHDSLRDGAPAASGESQAASGESQVWPRGGAASQARLDVNLVAMPKAVLCLAARLQFQARP